MIWFKKEKKSELPELPPIPMPPSPEEEKEIPSLPSFPTSRTGERMSRETVKQIIAYPPREETKVKKEEEGFEMPKPTRPEISEKGPIFIQIEQYHDLLKALDEAKNKVKSVSETLENIKKLKEKEEAEVEEWEKEIQEVKERLRKVDSTIFKKLE